jgi:tRNA modification GTPase
MRETIAAVSTAPGEGGIGIVRLSGERAEEILNHLFVKSRGAEEETSARAFVAGASFEDRKMRHGWIVDPVSKETVDEALCVLMRGPHSYTGEDVAEIQCHGGPVPLRRILRAAYALGAAPAEPGEFTKRAFLNGRIDLVQAGAVIDLINSRTDLAYRAARELADGHLSGRIREARERLLEALAEICVRIDYPEAFDYTGGRFVCVNEVSAALAEPLQAAGNILTDLLTGADRGRLVRDGLRTVIIGRPNVGKSSLYNALLRADAAIVAAEPGTTRDTLETWLDLGGAAVAVTDTAGIREYAGDVEQAGIRRAREAYARADVCLFVLDGAAPVTEEDRQIAENLDETKPTILVLNKNDLPSACTEEEALALAPFAIGLVRTTLAVSLDSDNEHAAEQNYTNKTSPCVMGEAGGLSSLEALLSGLVTEGKLPSEQSFLVTREAHKAALEKAAAEIREGLAALLDGEPPELAEVSVREAYRILGEMIGEEVSDEVINRVFEGFCVGK